MDSFPESEPSMTVVAIYPPPISVCKYIKHMRQLKIATTVTDRSGGIQEYLNQINKYPLLSIEDEVECARRIQKNDDEAYQRLVCANLRFVVSVAKQYQNKGLTLCIN